MARGPISHYNTLSENRSRGEQAVYAEFGRRLSVPMLAVALLVLPALVIEESSVGPAWHSVAVDLNWAVWVAFGPAPCHAAFGSGVARPLRQVY